MGFSKPAAAQESSHFLSLPAEVGQKTLRLLLKSPDRLQSEKQYNDRWQEAHVPGWDDKTNLSSQLLRCSQLLYHEGKHVLYEENVLSVWFTWQNGEARCDILGTSINFPPDPLDFLSKTIDRLAFDECPPGITIEPSDEWFISNAAIGHFGRVEVVLNTDLLDPAYLACHVLRALFKDAHISIMADEWYVEDEYHLDIWLASFACLRCKHVSFEGIPGERTRQIEKTITGGDPVLDLLPATKELHRVMIERGFSWPGPNGLSHSRYGGDTWRLRIHIFQCDGDGFEETKQEILDSAMVIADTTAEEGLVKIVVDAAEKIRDVNRRRDDTKRALKALQSDDT